METFWTSKKPIKGLRHFVLVNKTKEKGQKFFLMVSVLDCEINLKIPYKELITCGNWEKGWLNLSKTESITHEYVIFKSLRKKEVSKTIFINDDSLFNIS
jgi:tryptophan-rich hypothetical protein